MSAPVDVLAVMERLIGNSRTIAGLSGDPVLRENLRDGEMARAAVAELIEAGGEVSETHEAFQRNPTRNTANAANKADGRLRAALARVQGGAA